MEYLQWKIDGEFICDIARQWFWEENRDYEKCEELLLSALGTDELTLEEKKEIARDIIEGKKKLVGVNECVLVDDNKNVRHIQDKIKKINQKMLIDKIRSDMNVNAINYVDPYSTVKSVKSAKIKDVTTYEEVYNYFCFSEFDYDKRRDFTENDGITKCGLWLLDNPELVAKYYHRCASSSSDDFWSKMYEAIKDDERFKERNNKYLAFLRMKEDNERNLKEQLDKQYDKMIKTRTTSTKIKDFNEMTSEEYIEYLSSKEPGNLDYRLIPDNLEKFEGLIDKEGNFYSCEFGGHNIKAYYIIVAYYQKFGFKTREDAMSELKPDRALDNLLDAGWMATRYLPSMGCYLSYKRDIYFRPTKEQKNTIWNTIVKHDCYVQNTNIIVD